jgi:3-deoxy-7-phosphoheptulonate synthase
MSTHRINNVNIQSIATLTTPYEMRRHLPQTPATQRTVVRGRDTIERILDREDPRLLAVVGPCSIHDLKAAAEYAQRLQALATQIADSIFVIMRVYFEKPRTALGWKGLINDPFMNESFRVDEGLHMARRFLLEVNGLGLPAATEALDPLTPQYIGDLISWTAIGARTTESQTHRELASGLSTPVGFKNATDGSIEVAINAIKAAQSPHHFLGFTEAGLPAVFSTAGNPYPHLVLRGGRAPNHDPASVQRTEESLRKAGLPASIIVDCSHGNSEKQPERQAGVLQDILAQLEAGNRSIVGFMLESFLETGSQPFPTDLTQLRYGVSVTDACIGWDLTEKLLRDAHARHCETLAARRRAPAPR